MELPREGEAEFFAMNTVMRIRVKSLAPDEVLERCEAQVRRLEELTSAHLEFSEVSSLSRTGALYPSEDVRRLLRMALKAAKDSRGAFDPTIGALTSLWQIGTPNARVPKPWEIARAVRHVDYRGLFEDRDGRFHLKAGQRLDLGGIAKGFAGDVLAKELRSMGVQWAVLDLGGNVVVVGNPDKGPWRIGIQHPISPRGTILGVLEIAGPKAAVVTSGVYERFLEVGNRRYHHILDPKTGYPVQSGLLSVTVVSHSSSEADALSTALFVLGPKSGQGLLKRYGALALFVTQDRRVLISPELMGRFTLKDQSFRVEPIKPGAGLEGGDGP
ncbi:MAG: FAD:protein FMN transferase [Thermanaerothrix sp.]|nr:FAD:protein FMN transferase [Thermanaerothrix sp.]